MIVDGAVTQSRRWSTCESFFIIFAWDYTAMSQISVNLVITVQSAIKDADIFSTKIAGGKKDKSVTIATH